MKKLPMMFLVILSFSMVLRGQGYHNIITPGTAFYSGGHQHNGFSLVPFGGAP